MPARASLLVQPKPAVQPTVTIVDTSEKHWAVLTSLKRLTKRDFGFDQAAWRLWWDSNNPTNSDDSRLTTFGK